MAQATLILFVIVDPVSGMAYYQGFTRGATEEQKKIILRRAVLITMVVLWFFTFLGNVILFLLRINVNYIRIAGGVYILVYAVKSVLFGEEPEETESEDGTLVKPKGLSKRAVDRIAVVPLSVPLLAGPGAIASVMILNQPLAGGIYCIGNGLCIFGPLATAIAVAVVGTIAWALFSVSNKLVQKLNPSLLFTLGKVMDILVGAVAISFIVQGLSATFHIVL